MDQGRESLTDKASANLKPDSQKTLGEQAQEQAKGTYDSAASALQPEGDKSIGQKATDAVSGGSKPGEKGYAEQAQESLGNAATYVKDTANDLINKASDATSGNQK